MSSYHAGEQGVIRRELEPDSRHYGSSTQLLRTTKRERKSQTDKRYLPQHPVKEAALNILFRTCRPPDACAGYNAHLLLLVFVVIPL